MTCLHVRLLIPMLCCLPLLAVAQSTDLPAEALVAKPLQVDAQRVAINAKRRQLKAGFAAEDALCYERFAVNNCLQKVNVKRQVSMADLRRQDVLLNDQERKRHGAQEISRIEAKQSNASRQEPIDRRAKVVSEYQSRMQTVEQRQRLKASQPEVQHTAEKARADRLRASEAKAQVRRAKQASEAQQVTKFNERNLQAEKRRAEHRKQQAGKPATGVKGLPVPP